MLWPIQLPYIPTVTADKRNRTSLFAMLKYLPFTKQNFTENFEAPYITFMMSVKVGCELKEKYVNKT